MIFIQRVIKFGVFLTFAADLISKSSRERFGGIFDLKMAPFWSSFWVHFWSHFWSRFLNAFFCVFFRFFPEPVVHVTAGRKGS